VEGGQLAVGCGDFEDEPLEDPLDEPLEEPFDDDEDDPEDDPEDDAAGEESEDVEPFAAGVDSVFEPLSAGVLRLSARLSLR
jgi:hypothetical protein